MTTAATVELKTSVHQNPTKKSNEKPWTGKKYLQSIFPKNAYAYLHNIKITYKSVKKERGKEKRNTYTIQMKWAKDNY